MSRPPKGKRLPQEKAVDLGLVTDVGDSNGSVGGVGGRKTPPPTENGAYKGASELSVGGVGGIGGNPDVILELPEPAPFPIDSLPKSLAILSAKAALAFPCPPEHLALPGLVVLGSGIGNSRILRVKEGWYERALIYAMLISRPGGVKTPPMEEAATPARTVQGASKVLYEEQRAEYKIEHERWMEKKRRAIRDDGNIEREPASPTWERTVVGDTTVEALCDKLSQNPRGLALLRDELSAVVRGLNQYKGGAGSDRSYYLEFWNNNPNIAVDRRGTDDAKLLDRPYLSIYGTMQPDVMAEIDEGGKHDGFRDRFLISYPNPIPAYWQNDAVDETYIRPYEELYLKLRNLELHMSEQGGPEPMVVEMSPAALEQFVRVANSLVNEQLTPGTPTRLIGVFDKLRAYTARLALILALCRCAETGDPERVEDVDVLAAEKLVWYFLAHAKRVHAQIHGRRLHTILLSDLYRFAIERGGYWKGKTTDLHAMLDSEVKPGRDAELGKQIRALIDAHDTGGMEISVKSKRFPTSKDSSCSVTTLKVPTLDIAPNAPNAPNALNELLAAHGYGDAEPAVGIRKNDDNAASAESSVSVGGNVFLPPTPPTARDGAAEEPPPDGLKRLIEGKLAEEHDEEPKGTA